MSVKLVEQSYGKSAVRFTKVIRHGDWHEVVECAADVRLSGDFDKTYITGDNSQVIPTDTVKNTVYAIAKMNEWQDIETYGSQLAQHFLNSFAHVSYVKIKLSQVKWERIHIDENAHPHAFVRGANETGVCELHVDRRGSAVVSGLTGLQVLKTTASAFEGYLVDQFTTLHPAKDRIFATTVDANWTWFDNAVQCDDIRHQIRTLILNVFALEFSPSVQNTLYKIGEKILGDIPSIKDITISMPNQHRLLVDLGRIGLENANEIFCPTDEPYGDITATISRVVV